MSRSERVAFLFLICVVGFMLAILTLFFLPVLPYWLVVFVYATIGAIVMGELNNPSKNVKLAGFGAITVLIMVLLLISYNLGLVTPPLMLYYMLGWIAASFLFFRIDKLF